MAKNNKKSSAKYRKKNKQNAELFDVPVAKSVKKTKFVEKITAPRITAAGAFMGGLAAVIALIFCEKI